VLNSKIKSKKRFEQELTKLQNKLFDLNSEHWIELQDKKKKKKTETDIIHKKKLIALGIDEIHLINNENINTSRNKIDKIESILKLKLFTTTLKE
jgi:hypothetical protein